MVLASSVSAQMTFPPPAPTPEPAGSRLPAFSKLHSVCVESNQWIANNLERGGRWPDSTVNAASPQELLNLFEDMDLYTPFMLYNSLNPITTEWISRRIISATSRVATGTSFRSDRAEEAITSLETYFQNAYDHPDSVKMPSARELYRNVYPITEWAEMEKNIPAICKYLPMAKCLHTFQTLLEFARPYASNGGSYYTAYFTFSEFATDRNLIRGLAHFSLSQLGKIRLALTGHSSLIHTSDVWADLTHSFRVTGFSKKEADYAAMVTLGSYSIRGASYLDSSITHLFPGTSLSVLMTGISLFDRLQVNRGDRAYFLPKKIKIDCPYGKPYHFWMAAHLGYRARRAGIPKSSAAMATAFFGIAYELVGNSNGRDYRALLKLPPFSPQINQARMDIFYRNLGGYYGASYVHQLFAHRFDSTLYQHFWWSGRVPDSWIQKIITEMKLPDETALTLKWANLVAPVSSFSGLGARTTW
jgi:hypothetical protein